MEFDNSWAAVMQPDTGSGHFGFKGSWRFEVGQSEFSLVNALWLTEMCRTMYKPGVGLFRNEIYNPVGLTERHFFYGSSTQCALVEPTHIKKQRYAVLVFRGTSDLNDWMKNLDVNLACWPTGGRVHKGFADALDEIWSRVEPVLADLDVDLFITGHSLGGALAVLAAARTPVAPKATYTFGTPRVGDDVFVKPLNARPIYRLVNHKDVVPTIPPKVKKFPYAHAGKLRYIAHDGQLLDAPDPESQAADKRKKSVTDDGEPEKRKWHDAPEYFSDHAPVNYAAHLEHLILQKHKHPLLAAGTA